MSPLTPARQRRKEARPQELLDAALEVFVERGFAAARTDDVAQRAGVAKGTLYLYYASKDELLKAVIQRYIASEIAAGRDALIAHRGTAAAQLRDVVVPWWQRIVDSPASGVFKLVITEVRNFPDLAAFYTREVIEPGEQVLAGIVQRGIASGEFRPVEVHHAVFSMLFPLVMVCLHKHSLGPCMDRPMLDPHRFIRDHIELLIAGFAAPGGPGTSPA
jgi:AcrR family transcriptional regulator